MPDFEDLPSHESINAAKHLGVRPFCSCCGGGMVRGRNGKFSCTKATSHYQSVKARRSKPKKKDHR